MRDAMPLPHTQIAIHQQLNIHPESETAFAHAALVNA
jgi:hypothetical protein